MPFAFKKNFILNSTTTGFQGSDSVTALANGNFLATYISYDGGVTSDVRARLFKPDGTAVANDFLLNSTTALNQSRSVVTALANGKFVAIWETEISNTANYEIRGRLFNGNGTPVANDFLINSISTGHQYLPTITTLTNGRFLAAWASNDSGDYDIRARLFNANGTPVGADILLNGTTAMDQTSPSITALTNGRFIATWNSDHGTDTDIFARLFNANGTAVGNEFLVNNVTASQQIRPVVTQLTGGNIAMAWSTFDAGTGNYDIAARVFKADGTPLRTQTLANDTTLGPQYTPCITALHDGRFAVAWSSSPAGADFDIRMRIINANGTAAGGDFIVNSTTTASQSLPHITTLANGKIAVTWQSEDTGDGDSACVRGTIVDPLTYKGISTPDIYTGGSGDDRIFGNDGSDTLKGGLGKDVISGGAANDELTGGAGSDRLTGGAGNDHFIFKKLSDKGDVITDFAHGDVLVFESSAFKLGTYEGFLDPVHFVSRATGHVALHAGDFIFDRSTDQLWFDANGTASGGATMMADLNNINLGAGDILIL